MLNIFKKKPRCGHCNSYSLSKGYYNRGYNNLCRQASGDHGYFCKSCYKISWVDTYEDALRKTPEWCTVSESSTTVVKI